MFFYENNRLLQVCFSAELHELQSSGLSGTFPHGVTVALNAVALFHFQNDLWCV